MIHIHLRHYIYIIQITHKLYTLHTVSTHIHRYYTHRYDTNTDITHTHTCIYYKIVISLQYLKLLFEEFVQIKIY